MKPLPTTFTAKGFRHTEKARLGAWRIYERQGKGQPHFEVVRIIQEPDAERFGVLIPAHERYPGSETWGMAGFTLPCWPSAARKLETIAGQPSAEKTEL